MYKIQKEQFWKVLSIIGSCNPPIPAFVPTSGGGVQFEWTVGERELEIEVYPDGTIQYLLDGPWRKKDGAIPADQIEMVRPLIIWLVGGQCTCLDDMVFPCPICDTTEIVKVCEEVGPLLKENL
jgi:hypothetical protein